MTKEQALRILKQPDRIGCHLIKANDEESNKYNQESIEALDMAIKALEQSSEDWYDIPSDEMTLEQARQAVKDLRKKLTEYLEQQPSDCVSMEVYKQVIRERDIAIEQLKELGYGFGEKIRTSDDCVSRAEVQEVVRNTIVKYIPVFIGRYEKIPLELAIAIRDMPPVTPTRKVGKWEEVWESQRDEYTGEHDEWIEHKCSVCGFQEFDADRFKYCPNCGAEMKGSENE